MFRKNPTKGEFQSLLMVSILASVVFIGIIIASGQYRHPAFWLATIFIIGLTYLISLVPNRLGFWRWILIIIGYFAAVVFAPTLSPEQDISTVGIVFLLAVFWLPLIIGYRQSRTDSV